MTVEVAGEPVGLFDLPETRPAGVAPAGPVEISTRNALKAANLAATLEGLAQLAIAAATAVDVASRRSDPYAIAAAGRELRETFGKLGVGAVQPAAGGAGDLGDLLGGPEIVQP